MQDLSTIWHLHWDFVPVKTNIEPPPFQKGFYNEKNTYVMDTLLPAPPCGLHCTPYRLFLFPAEGSAGDKRRPL